MSNCARIFSLILLCCLLSGCNPQSSAVEPAIQNDTVVLVKKGNIYGAFIPRDQTMTPEALQYDWYYRTDGKGIFSNPKSVALKSGKGSSLPIKFGPFEVSWSGNDERYGWIYYDRFPDERVAPDDLRICVTPETDISHINAADSKWLYKASPADPGIRP